MTEKQKIKKYKKNYQNKNKEKIKKYKAEYYQRNKDKIKKYREKNKKKILKIKKIWREKNKLKIKKYDAEYRKKNREKLLEKKLIHYNKNKEKYKAWYQNYYKLNKSRLNSRPEKKEAAKKWRKNNPEKLRKIKRNLYLKNRKQINWRLSSNMSRAIYTSLKNNKKNKHWEDIVGYSLNELKIHLKNKFNPKMNWKNYGNYWVIDHIKPLAYFKIKNENDKNFKQAWSLKNLRPLEYFKNASKGSLYKGVRYFY